MRRNVLLILLVLLLAFIWGNSCMPVWVSSQESGWVLNLLRPLLEPFVGKGHVTHHLVRKLAHFTEFTALGAVLGLLLLSGQRRLVTVLSVLLLGLLVAFLDESIQMLSDRGDQIIDVWLDFSGVILGAVLAGAVLCLRRRRNKHP